MKEPAVIVDVDGTLADMGKGDPGRRGPFDWHRVSEDQPIEPVIHLVRMLRWQGFQILFLSGRKAVCRPDTIAWLERHTGRHRGEPLFMRANNDNRKDSIIKLEIYKRDIEPLYDVRYVIDDRDQVVKMWRTLGLTTLQVADGDF